MKSMIRKWRMHDSTCHSTKHSDAPSTVYAMGGFRRWISRLWKWAGGKDKRKTLLDAPGAGPTATEPDNPFMNNVDTVEVTVSGAAGSSIAPFAGAHDVKVKAVNTTVVHGNVTHIQNFNEMHDQDPLKSLLDPVGTSWDPARTCLSGTRTQIIQDITSWLLTIPASGTAEIFLVADAVGSGKSALAHTIAEEAHKTNCLVASFFFIQPNGENSTTRALFAALIRGLCQANQQAKNVAVACLQADSTLATAPPTRQFKELIAFMCEAVPKDKTFAIVVDALDEGFDMDLIKILRDHVPELPPNFRFVLTSRPEERIMKPLEHQPHVHRCKHSLSGVDSQSDIARYIDHELKDSEELSLLPQGIKDDMVDKSEGVFLWMAMVLNHVKQSFDPVSELKEVLSANSGYWRDDEKAGQKLDTLYGRVLSSFAWKDTTFREAYEKVVGAIVTAKEPLSLDSLASLYMDEGISAGTIAKVASRMRSLLDGFNTDSPQKPIRLLHLSIREYLTKRAPQPFFLDERSHHATLTRATLSVIDKELITANAPFLGYTKKPGFPLMFQTPDVTQDQHLLSPQLLYSCKFLMAHIRVTESHEFHPKHAPLLHRVLSKSRDLAEITAAIGPLFDLSAFRRWALEVRSAHNEPLHDGEEFDSDEDIADALANIGVALGIQTRFKEAVMAHEASNEMYRQLAEQDPVTFIPKLSAALVKNAHADFRFGKILDAVTLCEEAVQVCRDFLETEQSNASDANKVKIALAKALTGLSDSFVGRNNYNASMKPIEEAVDIYRQLAVEDPVEFEVNLAAALSLAALSMVEEGLESEARVLIEEALDIQRRLAVTNPAVHEEHLAEVLGNLAMLETKLGEHVSALKAMEEVVDIQRKLAKINPDKHNALLLHSLGQFSECLIDAGNNHAALDVRRDIVAIIRGFILAGTHPIDYDEDMLADALYDLGEVLANLWQHEAALAAEEECVVLWRRHASTHIGGNEGPLPPALCRLSQSQAALGRYEDALRTAEEAVVISRRLVVGGQDETFEDDFAFALTQFSSSLSALGRHSAAEEAAEEAVSIRRRQFGRDPDEYDDVHVVAVFRFVDCLLNLGDDTGAAAAVEELGTILHQRDCSEPNVDGYNLASHLFGLAGYLTRLNKYDESLAALQGAVAARRHWVARNPTTESEQSLATDLCCLARALDAQGNGLGAKGIAEEVVVIYRRFVERNLPGYEVMLGCSLVELSCFILKLGDGVAALSVCQESLSILGQKAQLNLGGNGGSLALAFSTLSKCLVTLNRHDESLVALKQAIAIRRKVVASNPVEEFNLLEFMAYDLEALANYLHARGQEQGGTEAMSEAAEIRAHLATIKLEPIYVQQSFHMRR